MKLRVYGKYQASRYNASAYYRTVLPLTWFTKLGLTDQVFIDEADQTTTQEETWMLLGSADIILAYQLIEPRFVPYMHFMRGLDPQLDDSNNLRYPPSFVASTDDDLFNVPPLNPSFERLGYKNPATHRPLDPGDKISITNARTGQPVPLWKDGEFGFDAARNRRNVEEGWGSILRNAEATIVTSTRLAEAARRYAGLGQDHNFIVFPNCVDFDQYDQHRIDLAPHEKEIRILYQGSTTHHEDLWPLRQAFGRLAKKYPHTKWIFWGVRYKWAAADIPPEQVEWIPWVDYRMYPLKLQTIGFDINIAPLSGSVFNNSRTPIKWYEASAIRQAAPTIASNYGPYAEEMIDGETGLLFNNEAEFEQKMAGLIEDATLRQTLAANAKDWVRTNRAPEKWVPELYGKLVEVREKRLKWPPELKAHYRKQYDEAMAEQEKAHGTVPEKRDDADPGAVLHPGVGGTHDGGQRPPEPREPSAESSVPEVEPSSPVEVGADQHDGDADNGRRNGESPA